MGGTVGRILAGVGTVGGSELVQKKPFQPGPDKPINKTAETARYVPGGAIVAGVTDMIMPKKPDIPQPTAPPSTGDQAVQAAVAEGANRRARARGYRSTILSQMLPSSMRETFGS